MRRFSNPVLVSGHTRSGTNLLMRLIDGTPRILVPPGEGKLNVMRRLFGLEYPLVGSATSIAETIWSNIELNLDTEREAAFRRLLVDHVGRSAAPRGFIDTLGDLLETVSRFTSTPPDAAPHWLEKNHNLEFYWNRSVVLFGRPKLLFVLRNPFDNWLSWRQYMNANGLESSVEVFGGIMRQHLRNELDEASCGASRFDSVDDMAAAYGFTAKQTRGAAAGDRCAGFAFDASRLRGADTAAGRFAWNYRLMYERARALQARFEDVLIVSYEEVVLNTDETMRRVMSFLECDWSDVHLRPTDHGSAWGGNSSFASTAGVVDAKTVGRGMASLSLDEIESIRAVLAGVPGVMLEAATQA